MSEIRKLVRLRNMLVALVAAGGLGVVSQAHGQAHDALLDLLVRKGVITDKEMKELKQELDADLQRHLERQNKTKVAGWIEEMKWSGDLRLRAEFFDNEDQSNDNDRWRYRLRMRLGMDVKFKDWARFGLRLATGGDDPVSTNQSFQDTFSRKTIGIDLAYVTLTPPFANWISVSGGKIRNPIWQPDFLSPLQYDGDVTPEGLGEQIKWTLDRDNRFVALGNFGQFVLDEVSGDSNDPWLVELQGGLQANLGGPDAKKSRLKITAMGGFSQTFNLQNMGVASGSQPAGAASPAAQSTSPNRGNATRQPGGAGTTLFYLDDFRLVYGRGELVWTVREQPFFRTPAVFTLAGEYITNLTDAYDDLNGSTQTKSPDQTDGYTIQIAFGGTRKQGEWQVAYQYKYLEADAVWDAVTDSDWGMGGTDREGHVVSGQYNIRDWWSVGCKASLTDKISSRPNAGQNTRGNVTASDLLRVQVDTVFKF